MLSVKNKIVLITGASSGIGEACAKIFAQHGAKLLLCARRLEKLQQLAKELQDIYQVEIFCFKLDIADAKAVKDAIRNLPDNWKEIDILINNAGIALGLDKFQEASIEDWEQMIDINVKGLLYMTKAVLPQMLKRDKGHIINVGSIAGHEVYTNGNVYCATKAAVNALTKGMKLDLLGTKIRVTSVDPGLVETNFSTTRFKGNKERAAQVYEGYIPLSADDIADAIFYCASRPEHINIREMIIFPTAQGNATTVYRKPKDN